MYLAYPLLLDPELRPILVPVAMPDTGQTDTRNIQRLLYDHMGSLDTTLDIVTIVFFVWCFVSNFALSFLFVIFEGVRSVPSNHFICTLALSNVLISIHLVSFNILQKPLYGPSELCDFAVYGGVIFCASSNLSRCAIAIDRYIFISDPLRYYQRTQTTCRAFSIGSIFLFLVTVIVSPYIFRVSELEDQESCLPIYPKVYVGCVTFLLTVAPAILLVLIYTRIFYWAFLQMQILRQEAKHFMQKQNLPPWNPDFTGSSSIHSSISSKHMRVYTGAAILLTPNSPFSSRKHSLDTAYPGGESPGQNMQTTVHRIIHLLSDLKASRRDSLKSTSVDKKTAAASGKGPFRQFFSRLEETASVGTKSLHSNKNASSVGYDQNSRASSAYTVSMASTAFSKNTTFGHSSTPIDNMYGTFWGGTGSQSPGRGGASVMRAYVPVTPQGRWMERQLMNYDVEVVRESVASTPDIGQNIMCKLLKAEIKAAVMIMALMGSFVLCWIPFVIIQIVHIFDIEEVTHFERKTQGQREDAPEQPTEFPGP